ncbi:hypothetical protein ISS21_00185 [Patescibacteria group bacterium]|nr:hypothetical protein [Patescibacteria group bacterium]
MKKNIVIIIVIAVVVVGGIIFFLSQKGGPVSETEVLTNEEAGDKTGPPESEQATLVDPGIALKSQLTLQARSFIERYGSYSSDSGYSNLKELLSQMSEKFAAETSARIAKGFEGQEGFFALVTKVMSLELKEFIPESRALFSIQVQEQNMMPGQTDLLYKTVALIFIKEGNEWKVDEIKNH